MTTFVALRAQVRQEIGDAASAFLDRLTAPGGSNRFELSASPIDGGNLQVIVDDVDVSTSSWVEEHTGVLSLADYPPEGASVIAFGQRFRYFTNSEIDYWVGQAFAQHTAYSASAAGGLVTVEALPPVEEYLVVLLASVQALYALANDASLDIDVHAPDGVMVPRSQRYRQLLEMIQYRQGQYDHLSALLGVGLNAVTVFRQRRVARSTERLVPVFVPQEIEETGRPTRAVLPRILLGSKPRLAPGVSVDFELFQEDSFEREVTLGRELSGLLDAQVRVAPGAPAILAVFAVAPRGESGPGQWVYALSLSSAQTRRLPTSCVWDLQETTPGGVVSTVAHGNMFVARDVTRV